MEETRWLDEREARAWRGFISMQTQLLRRLARQMQHDDGLSEADFEVLVRLSEAPEGRQRVFELGQATQWEKSRLSHHLSRMVQRGLVVRETCPTDSRGAFVKLTEAGRRAIEDAAPRHVAHVRRWFIDALSPEQLDALAGIAHDVLDGLGETAESGSCTLDPSC
jgi:DNA-binding MarR family transcriptional regulator